MLDARTVGLIIYKCRVEKRLSQEVVSGLAGIGRTHLSAIERGERKPTLETFFRIAEAMNIPPHELMLLLEKEIYRSDI